MKNFIVLPLAATFIFITVRTCKSTDEITRPTSALQVDQPTNTSSFDEEGDPKKDMPKDRDHMRPVNH